MNKDFNSWPNKEYSINALLLDEENPRIKYGEENQKLNQKQIINFLIENEKVFELARDISEENYFPIENLIVCIENGKKVVLEGNRRAAALKILQEPNKYLSKNRANILLKNISQESYIATNKVKCVVAPDRESAMLIIYKKHRGLPLERWKTGNQYKYVVDICYRENFDIDKVCEILNENRSSILSILKIYNLFLEGKEILEEEGVFIDNGNFEFTNLERLYNYAPAREISGIDFSEDKGELIVKLPDYEFKKRISEIFKILKNEKGFSRKFNSEKDKEKFIERLKENPNFDFSVSNIEGQIKSRNNKKEDFSLESNKEQNEVLPKPKLPTKCIPDEKEIIFNDQKLDALFKELKSLSNKKVYSFAILLRSYLEQSLYFYLTQNNLMDDLSEKLNARNKKHNEKKVETLISSLKGRYGISEEIDPELIMKILKFDQGKDYSNVGLKDMLDYVNDHRLGSYLNLDTKELQVVKEEIELIKKGMDLAVHNIKYPLSFEHNKTSWEKLEPLLEALSNNINTENK